jgi:hypothetical protein
MMTQRDRILEFMHDYGWITPMDAIHEFGCTKLATRVSELIREGYEIEKQTVTDKNRWGQTVRYMRYRLAV